jgi:hypothetical protein
MASRSYKNLQNDLKQKLTADLNALITYAVSELSTAQVSPVLTGFFASSWKADTRRPQPKDELKNFSPWNTIKKQGKFLAPGNQPVIAPRYVVPEFRLNSTIFIGNTAKYANNALASPKSQIPQFVQGEFNDLIKLFFTDKNRPRIRVATQQGREPLSFFGVGRETYVSYQTPEDQV